MPAASCLPHAPQTALTLPHLPPAPTPTLSLPLYLPAFLLSLFPTHPFAPFYPHNFSSSLLALGIWMEQEEAWCFYLFSLCACFHFGSNYPLVPPPLHSVHYYYLPLLTNSSKKKYRTDREWGSGEDSLSLIQTFLACLPKTWWLGGRHCCGRPLSFCSAHRRGGACFPFASSIKISSYACAIKTFKNFQVNDVVEFRWAAAAFAFLCIQSVPAELFHSFLFLPCLPACLPCMCLCLCVYFRRRRRRRRTCPRRGKKRPACSGCTHTAPSLSLPTPIFHETKNKLP